MVAFRFTEEDFERYVTKTEHGGRHIWDDLLDLLKAEFGFPFYAAPYIRRGDWLQTLWFQPHDPLQWRPSWKYQSQFWLSRDIEQARLFFGWMVEHMVIQDDGERDFDTDLDSRRFINHLKGSGEFRDLIDRLIQESGFHLEFSVWDRDSYQIDNAAELLARIEDLPDAQGWDVKVFRSLSKEEALAQEDHIAEHIMDAFRKTRPLFEKIVPDSVRRYFPTGKPPSKEKCEEMSSSPGAVGISLLRDYLVARGFSFTPHQIATFATALQTKGFVILSGISGTGKTKLAQHFADLLHQGEEPNHIFVPVRPDWRDSKSLLGYYNPLTETFASTPFLRFLLQAQSHYDEQRQAALPHFVILDEMNLARVEYYFADFLSVLESGRDDDGYSREAIALHSFRQPVEDAEGQLVPPSLRLPPNLYIIGTVNVDETTHAFSPKVLDRAFTLEFTEVHLTDYPPTPGDAAPLPDEARRALAQAFTRQGRFAVVDKAQVSAFVETHPAYRERLAVLNDRLRPHDLHFAYRVFDEIITFLDNREAAPWADGFADLDDAFDTAVLMKVLPKFHGSRGRLLDPLRAVLAWAQQPDAPDSAWAAERTQTAADCLVLRQALDEQIAGGAGDTTYPRTARKAVRMLRQLHNTGFASFE